jgi:hypothetical protein
VVIRPRLERERGLLIVDVEAGDVGCEVRCKLHSSVRPANALASTWRSSFPARDVFDQNAAVRKNTEKFNGRSFPTITRKHFHDPLAKAEVQDDPPETEFLFPRKSFLELGG